MESVTAIATGTLLDLSEQELVDCAVQRGNRGCLGGYTADAYEYIIENPGISFEQDYPYRADNETCNTAVLDHAVRIAGYENVPQDETSLLNAVVMQPVSIAIDANSSGFGQYAGGVYDGPCGTDLMHAVAMVGYGMTPEGVPYWLIRNSWGVGWGEQGYMRIRRNTIPGGLCGLALEANYPESFYKIR